MEQLTLNDTEANYTMITEGVSYVNDNNDTNT